MIKNIEYSSNFNIPSLNSSTYPWALKCNRIFKKIYNKRSSQTHFQTPFLYLTRYTITIQFLKCISSFRTSSHQCKHNTFYLDTTAHHINVVLMAFHLLILNYLIVVQKGLNWKINWRQSWQFSSQYFKLVPLFIFCCRFFGSVTSIQH